MLAGGAGLRAGGRDKGLLPVGDGTAAEAAIATLRPRCGRVIVSANRNLEIYRGFPADTVITDLRPGYPGPLAGLESLVRLETAEQMLVLPCDMPDISPGVYDRLLERLRKDESLDVVHATTQRGSHYLVAALRRRALTSIPGHLDRGEGAVRTWLAGLQVATIDFDGAAAESFRNRNQASDWE